MKILSAKHFSIAAGLAISLLAATPAVAESEPSPQDQTVASLIEAFNRINRELSGHDLGQDQQEKWGRLLPLYIGTLTEFEEGQCSTITMQLNNTIPKYDANLCKQDGVIVIGPEGVEPKL